MKIPRAGLEENSLPIKRERRGHGHRYIRVLANNAFVGLRTAYLCIIGRQLAVFS
ncbi:MAG: hypothetical protein PHW20_07980 [Clostridia bacterium]|nr:hypothetical protein [Clostridia bacterium]